MHTQNKDDRSSPALLSTYVYIHLGFKSDCRFKEKKFVFLKESVSHMVELRLKKKRGKQTHL